jgi:hypothetical protein
MDEFERFLQQQPPRDVPRDWRREILAAAEREPAAAWWRQLFWPSPLAWATVGALWLIIAGLNLAARPPRRAGTARRDEPAAAVALALAEKRQLLDELAGPDAAPVARPAVPGPHGRLRAPNKTPVRPNWAAVGAVCNRDPLSPGFGETRRSGLQSPPTTAGHLAQQVLLGTLNHNQSEVRYV